MYCRKCGKKISDHAQFCDHCGAEVVIVPQQSYADKYKENKKKAKEPSVKKLKEPKVNSIEYSNHVTAKSGSNKKLTKIIKKVIKTLVPLFFFFLILNSFLYQVFLIFFLLWVSFLIYLFLLYGHTPSNDKNYVLPCSLILF